MPETTRKKEPAPSWHELVQPPSGAARANPTRTRERRRKLGQLVELTVTVDPPPSDGPNRAMRRRMQGRGYNPGRVVAHRPKPAHLVHVDAHGPVFQRRLTACGAKRTTLGNQERSSTILRRLRRRMVGGGS